MWTARIADADLFDSKCTGFSMITTITRITGGTGPIASKNYDNDSFQFVDQLQPGSLMCCRTRPLKQTVYMLMMSQAANL